MILLCALLIANMLVMGFLAMQVMDIQRKYEAVVPVIRQVADSNLIKLFIRGESLLSVLSTGRIIPEVVDQDFIQFNWPGAAAAVVKGASYVRKIAEAMSFHPPTDDIKDIFLYIQTYADWTSSIAQVATQVRPVGGNRPELEQFIANNDTDDLDSILDSLGELLPFLHKQIDIPKWQAGAKNCAQLFKNVLNVQWTGKYHDYHEHILVDWRMPYVIQNEVFPTIYETCDAASTANFRPKQPSSVTISE